MLLHRVKLSLVFAALVLLVLCVLQTSALEEPVGPFSRLRRVQKSPTPSTAKPPHNQPPESSSSGRPPKERLLKSRSKLQQSTPATAAAGEASKTHGEPAFRQRLEQSVQKVRARSKELKMEQEQKRVDRKLRRDQKKLEREQPAPLAEPINPHNLKMPECQSGKVYNGRRCVVKH